METVLEDAAIEQVMAYTKSMFLKYEPASALRCSSCEQRRCVPSPFSGHSRVR